MKRVLLSIVLLLVLAGAAGAAPDVNAIVPKKPWSVAATLTGGVVADNTTVTITLPTVGNRAGVNSWLWVPTITSSTVTIQASYDGTLFGPLQTFEAGTGFLTYNVAAGTGGFFLKMPNLSAFLKIKVVCGTAQAANRAFVLFGD